MPVLGDQSSTNSEYLRTIRDILDDDIPIQRRVGQNYFKNYGVNNGEVVIKNGPRIEGSAVEAMKNLVINFNTLLEKYIIEMKIYHAGEVNIGQNNKFTSILPVITLYNQMIKMIQTPTYNIQTNMELKKEMVKILPYVKNSLTAYNLTIQAMIFDEDNKRPDDIEYHTIGGILFNLIRCSAVMELINNNISKDRFVPIEDIEVGEQISKDLVNKYQIPLRVRNLFLKRINETLSEFPTNREYKEKLYEKYGEEIGQPLTDREKRLIDEKHSLNPANDPYVNRTIFDKNNQDYKNLLDSLDKIYNDAQTTAAIKKKLATVYSPATKAIKPGKGLNDVDNALTDIARDIQGQPALNNINNLIADSDLLVKLNKDNNLAALHGNGKTSKKKVYLKTKRRALNLNDEGNDIFY